MGGSSSKASTNTTTSGEKIVSHHDEKRRTMIATEVVETEKAYVNNLKVLIKVYLEPLKDSALKDKTPILQPNEIKDVFGIIEVLVNFHAGLQQELEERMKKWGPQYCLGDIFEKNNAFFKMISTYVNGYNKSLNTYTLARQKNKNFDKFLQKCIESGEAKMDLQSYLIMPVQRLPRYVLLLTELVKYSDPKHSGYPALTKSLDSVKKVADFVNEAKKDAESAQKMLSIQENIVGKRARPILEPTRKFFNEGPFTWFNSSTNAPRPLQYFLFSDSILLAVPEMQGFFTSSLKWNLKIMCPYVSVDINEAHDSDRFNIVTPTKTFTVELEQGVDRDEWIKVFYWLKSGCGPRAEKIMTEAQKRQYRKSETVEHLRPQKMKKDDSKAIGTLPKKMPSELASSGETSPPGPSKTSTNVEKGKAPETSVKGASPEVSSKKDEKGKSPEIPPRKDEKGKSPETPRKDEKGKSPEVPPKKDEKGKAPEQPKSPRANDKVSQPNSPNNNSNSNNNNNNKLASSTDSQKSPRPKEGGSFLRTVSSMFGKSNANASPPPPTQQNTSKPPATTNK